MEKLIKKYNVVNDELKIETRYLFSKKFLVLISGIVISVILSLLFLIGSTIGYYDNEVDKCFKSVEQCESIIVKLSDSLDNLDNDLSISMINHQSGKCLINPIQEKPTKESVYNLAVECGAWYPDIIVAQCLIESNVGTSNIYKKTNNMFGMKIVSKNKMTTQSGNHNSYGTYKNWKLSVIDRVLMDRRYFSKKPSRKEYEEKLLGSYSETDDYLARINLIVNNLNFD